MPTKLKKKARSSRIILDGLKPEDFKPISRQQFGESVKKAVLPVKPKETAS